MATANINNPEPTVSRTNARRLHANVSARGPPAIYSQSRFSYMLTPIEDAFQTWPPVPRHEINLNTAIDESVTPPVPTLNPSTLPPLPVEQGSKIWESTRELLGTADSHTTLVAPYTEGTVPSTHYSNADSPQHMQTQASHRSESTPAAIQTSRNHFAVAPSTYTFSHSRAAKGQTAEQPQPPMIFNPLPPSSAKEQSDAKTVANASSDKVHQLLSSEPVPFQFEHSTMSPRNTSSPFTPTPSSTQPLFSPFSPSGPNGATLRHAPGQIPHPNMQLPSSTCHWHNPLCGLSSLLPLGLACPCIIYSRTQHRLSQRSRHADPTDMLGHETCNGHCALWVLACGLQGLLTGLLSARVRRTYGIDGGWGSDVVKGCCCCWCALVQGEREIRGREEERMRWAGPAKGMLGRDVVYRRLDGMRYENGSGVG